MLELGCGAAPAAGLVCIAIGCSVLMTDLPPVLEHTVRDLPGWLSALSVFHSKSVLCGAFVWARIARRLTSKNGGFGPGQETNIRLNYSALTAARAARGVLTPLGRSSCDTSALDFFSDCPGHPGASLAFSIGNLFCMALLYGHALRLTAENGGFRPGQCRSGWPRSRRSTLCCAATACSGKSCTVRWRKHWRCCCCRWLAQKVKFTGLTQHSQVAQQFD